mgnify:FL=1
MNDGDTALLICFLGLLVWTVSRHKIYLAGKGLTIYVIAILVMLLGIIATQSRTVILTAAMVFVVYYWLRIMMQNKGGGIRVFVYMFGIVVFLGTVAFAALNADS